MIADVFTAAGLEGFVHAIDDSGREFGFRSDEPIQPASMAKLFVLAALDQRVDLRTQVRIPAGNRTPGATGLSLMTHEALMSVHDLAVSMISVSDNHATDALLDVVDPTDVTATLRALGLTISRLGGYGRDLLKALAAGDEATLAPATSPWSTTARELTALVRHLWCGANDELRYILGTQVLSRFAPAFADAAVSIASKTGTLREHRGETGVVQFADGGWVAVTVAVRTKGFDVGQPDADLALGIAARAVVDEIRSAR